MLGYPGYLEAAEPGCWSIFEIMVEEAKRAGITTADLVLG